MCGIVGILYKEPNRICSEQTVLAMRDIMDYRGPDEAGLYLDGNLGLGHRRLSIIGLSTGQQPLANEDGSLWIVFNGEIYNYLALKQKLINQGHIFKTESDTEVILHLYEQMGKDCVHELNGMFAFAIWDRKRKNLFLVRDRLGIKPIYYANTDKTFLFSSEIKALFKSRSLTPQCNEEAIPEYLLFRNVAGERTLFKDVFTLLPGHTLSVSEGRVMTDRYWSPLPHSSHKRNLSYGEAKEELTSLLCDSVKLRMMSEVPLGTFCSGGIDSSLVTAIAAGQVSHAVNTFSVGFHESGYDETEYARMVSKRYGTTHHEIRLSNVEFAELLPKMIWHNDEPLNFANSVQIYAVSKLAKKHVTVVLTGEGADEIFAGYPRYQIPLLVARLQKFPQLTLPLIKIVYRITRDHRLNKLLRFGQKSIRDTIFYNTASSELDFMQGINLEKACKNMDYRQVTLDLLQKFKSTVLQVSLFDQLTYLVSILYRQDKMSMAASIESRVPFLDYRIVEFANSLPIEYKLKYGKRKRILQDIAAPFLPKVVISRRKSGFGVPLANWLSSKEGMGDLARELFSTSTKSRLNDILDIGEAYSEHLEGQRDNSELLWSCINFLLWERQYLS